MKTQINSKKSIGDEYETEEAAVEVFKMRWGKCKSLISKSRTSLSSTFNSETLNRQLNLFGCNLFL